MAKISVQILHTINRAGGVEYLLKGEPDVQDIRILASGRRRTLHESMWAGKWVLWVEQSAESVLRVV